MKHKLEGVKGSNQVWLDDEKLDIKTSQKIRKFSDTFDWGIINEGSTQLALAIVLTLTGSYIGLHKFRNEFIVGLSHNEDFRIEFEFDYNPIRDEMIRDAMTINKFLTKQFLSGKSNKELLCWVHPTYRDSYAFRLGYRKYVTENSEVYF